MAESTFAATSLMEDGEEASCVQEAAWSHPCSQCGKAGARRVMGLAGFRSELGERVQLEVVGKREGS